MYRGVMGDGGWWMFRGMDDEWRERWIYRGVMVDDDGWIEMIREYRSMWMYRGIREDRWIVIEGWIVVEIHLFASILQHTQITTIIQIYQLWHFSAILILFCTLSSL